MDTMDAATPASGRLAVLAIVVVSMVIGGAVVAAAYQAQTNERRDVLLSAYQGQVRLAAERLNLAKTQLQGPNSASPSGPVTRTPCWRRHSRSRRRKRSSCPCSCNSRKSS